MLRAAPKHLPNEVVRSSLQWVSQKDSTKNSGAGALIPRLTELIHFDALENLFGIAPVADQIRQHEYQRQTQHCLKRGRSPYVRLRNERSFRIEHFIDAEKPENRNVIQNACIAFGKEAYVRRNSRNDEKDCDQTHHCDHLNP